MNRAMRLGSVFFIAALLLASLEFAASSTRAGNDGRGHDRDDDKKTSKFDKIIGRNARVLLEEGRRIFRFDTFGDEAFWGDTLRLHEAIAGAKNGGVGPGVSPRTALAVGLKVDSDALPKSLIAALKNGQVNLDDPATTLALLKLNAVRFVSLHSGRFPGAGNRQAVGWLAQPRLERGRHRQPGAKSATANGFAGSGRCHRPPRPGHLGAGQV